MSTTKLTYQIPAKQELFNQRLVANVTLEQKSFVQEMSKKFGTESEFIRFILDRFMEKDIIFTEGAGVNEKRI